VHAVSTTRSRSASVYVRGLHGRGRSRRPPQPLLDEPLPPLDDHPPRQSYLARNGQVGSPFRRKQDHACPLYLPVRFGARCRPRLQGLPLFGTQRHNRCFACHGTAYHSMPCVYIHQADETLAVCSHGVKGGRHRNPASDFEWIGVSAACGWARSTVDPPAVPDATARSRGAGSREGSRSGATAG
jgi:hypothetical protein